MIDIDKTIRYAKDLKLLYVEDNKGAREAILLFLENIFKDIVVAVDGIDGLNKFKNNQDIDIVITDIDMPNMDGLEMTRIIKEVNSSIPVFIFSSHSDTNYFIDSIKLGVEGYLLKPFDMSQFLQVLNKSIDKLNLEKTQEKVSLSIIDNAGGIPQNVLEHIFKPHFTTKEEGKGTGIGLYMTKQIIDKMGATIDVTNRAGGACFKITIFDKKG